MCQWKSKLTFPNESRGETRGHTSLHEVAASLATTNICRCLWVLNPFTETGVATSCNAGRHRYVLRYARYLQNNNANSLVALQMLFNLADTVEGNLKCWKNHGTKRTRLNPFVPMDEMVPHELIIEISRGSMSRSFHTLPRHISRLFFIELGKDPMQKIFHTL